MRFRSLMSREMHSTFIVCSPGGAFICRRVVSNQT